MVLPRVEEIPDGKFALAPHLEVGIGHDVGGREGGDADGEEILGAGLVVHQLGPLDAHHLEAEADEADIVDVGRDVRPRIGEARPGLVAPRLGEDAVPQLLGQFVVDDELGPDHSVGLGVAGPLHLLRREILDEMVAHRVDHRLDVLLLVGLDRLVRQRQLLVLARQVDRPLQNGRGGVAEQAVPGAAEEGLEAPFDEQAPGQEFMQPEQPHSAFSLSAGTRIESSRIMSAAFSAAM